MFAVAIDKRINPIHFKLTISYMAMLICIKKHPQFTLYCKQLPFKKVGTVACLRCFRGHGICQTI